MARRTPLSPELKKAIQSLSGKEKDKLIFRLLPGKPALVSQLQYELLEDGDTQELRREELAEEMEQRLTHAVNNFYSPGYLLLDLRAISGDITRHVKTTRDRQGEIELNLLMLVDSIPRLIPQLSTASRGRARTLNTYVVKRVRKILSLLSKQPDDLRLDYQEDLERIGRAIGSIDSMMHTAIQEGLDVNWLLKGDWPKD